MAREDARTPTPIGVVLPPLADQHGRPYEHIPCAENPANWDEDATTITKRRARRACLTDCPALKSCEARLYQVGRKATGVWAGRILAPSGDDFPRERDPLIVRWARQAGIELPEAPK